MNRSYHIVKDVKFISLVICILGTIFYCYEYYLRIMPSVLRPELKLLHHISEAGFGLLASLYYWAYVPLQLPAGFVMDFWGPRKVLTIACLLCSIGTYLFVSDTLLIAQIGRFLVGFGSAFAYVGVLKLSNIWLPKKFFAFMAGFCSMLGMLSATGNIIITKAAVAVGWQKTLYYSAVTGVFLSIILWFCIKDHSINSAAKLRAQHKRLWHELVEIIKLPAVWLNGIIGCLMYTALSVFADTWAVSFLMAAGIKEQAAVFSCSMVFIGFGVGAPLWGILSDLVSSRKTPLMLGSIISIVLIFMILYMPMDINTLNIYMFLFGFFVSAEVLVFAAVNDCCHEEISATAIGCVNMLVMIGALVLQPCVGLILDYLVDNYNFVEIMNFRLALAILPVGLVISVILSMFLVNGIKQKPIV